MPEIIACPQCGRQLSVQDALVGQQVKCPACQTTFTAEPTPAPRREEAPAGRREARRDDEYEDRPRRRRYEDEDDYDDRPRRRYEDEDEDDRVRVRRRPDPRKVKEAANNKVAAGICGILIGAFGVHKFILGLTTPGVIMLLVTLLTCGIGGMPMGIIGLIEGIIYLTKSDEDFYRDYYVDQKGWF